MTHVPFILAAQSAIDRFFLPHPASNLAKDVDWAWNFVLGITTFFFVVVVGAMTVFVIKYRRTHPNQKTSTITHNTPLEIMWTAIPLVIVLAIFFIGFKGFLNYDTPASNCIPIDVQAKKWQFTFNYANGASDGNLYLLKGVPVVLNIQSSDVLHAVYVPAFRTQRNAVPGRTTQIWFIPEEASTMPLDTDPGGFDLFCTQYCGEQHSKMGARVYVYNDDADGKAAYEKKMVELANPFKVDKDGKSYWVPYAQVGEKFYHTYCAQCHTIDGKTNTGPTWKGLYKSDVKFSFPAGQMLSASASDQDWDDYLNESILHPSAKIVDGFQNQMSDFTAQLSGSPTAPTKDEKRRAIIEFIKSIGVTPYKPVFNPKDNPELFIVDKDHPNHPESLAYKMAAATQPAPAK